MGANASTPEGADARRCPISRCCASDPERVRLLNAEDEPRVVADGDSGSSPIIPSIVQFSTVMYYCTEDEGEALVDVVRLGETSGLASFDFETANGSAKAGVRYGARSGSMTFEVGETTKTIRIPVVQDDSWDATLEFSVVLTRVRGAQMGKYLHRCRVSIIDDDVFPTNKYKDALEQSKDLESIPGISLMMEYVKLNLSRTEIYRKTVKCILADFVKSSYYFMTLYLQLYLVDVVIMGGKEGHAEEGEGGERRLFLRGIHGCASLVARALEEAPEGSEAEGEEAGEEESFLSVEGWPLVLGNRRYTAVVVGLLYICPLLLLQIIDNCRISWEVGGSCRKLLQANLFRKFLNYKESSRSSISTGDITMAMMRDVHEVVDFGYMKMLEVIRILLKLCLASIFILAENEAAAIPLAVFPVIMGCFLCLRERVTIEANEDMAHRQNHLVHTVNNAITNIRLIADFHLRPLMVGGFEDSINLYNNRQAVYKGVVTNNTYLAPWLTTVFVGVYMIIGAFQTEQLGGTLTLGTFMATVSVFKEIGVELKEIYIELMEVQTTFGPLKKVAFFLNFPTDLEQRMRVNRERRAQGKVLREQARDRASSTGGTYMTDSGDVVFAVDLVQIELSNVNFSLGDGQSARRVLDGVSVTFAQGRFYALIGPPRQGKATLLKLLGQVLVLGAECGFVLVPPHLRVLHVSRETCILDEGLFTNVVFNNDVAKQGGFERVRTICERCGFSERMMVLLEQRGEEPEEHDDVKSLKSKWASQLSLTDLARLNLARALFMNPECLVMHMPAISFGDEEAKTIMSLIRAHVDGRGLELSVSEQKLRRPRTVFCSSSVAGRCADADIIYKLNYGRLREIDKNSAGS